MERAQAHLVVRAEGDSALPGEWLSADEFAARASWLHDAAAAGGGGCAWSASAAALGVPEEGEGAELAPLRRELAAARAELELARAEMQEQELLVEQARGDGAEPALSPCGGDRGERCAEECPGMEEPPGSSEGCRKEALEALDGLWAVIENAGARRRQLRAS
ncbi:unnamed protein product [Prorocentrum cordatum]|uniref:Uncharacterized protein n=1 Tax=Prorocentrum cordatum TaxID=2364126 RepID=A0ABN9X7J1_9DINO|nr:unnamed protein product [Polarella glacialis]